MSRMGVLKKLGLSGAQYNALKSLSHTDMSASAIIEHLKGTGAAVRRTTGLQAIRAFRDIAETKPYFKSVNYEDRLNPARIPTAVGAQKRRYSYEIAFDVRNKDTGEIGTLFRNYSSTDLITKQEAVDAWLESFSTNRSTSDWEIRDYVVNTVTEDMNYRA